MAYHSGVANSFSDLLSSLISNCQLDGWSYDGGLSALYKAGGPHVSVYIDSSGLHARGLLGLTTVGQDLNPVRMGRLMSSGAYNVSFPCNYHQFVFQSEVYMVVNYDSDYCMFISFGKSAVTGLPGSGTWTCGTAGNGFAEYWSASKPIGIASVNSFGNTNKTTGAFCWSTNSFGYVNANFRLDHGFYTVNKWNLTDETDEGFPMASNAQTELYDCQPNAWNSEAVLLPCRAYAVRPSTRYSLVFDAINVRHVRVDNLDLGQIVTLGPDQWMTFPFFRKYTSQRDGLSSSSQGIDHTGTFGWAIKYEP